MANVFITPDIIARESLISTEDRIVFGNTVYRGYAQEWAGAAVGETIRIKKVAEMEAKEYDGTSDIVFDDVVQSSVPLTIEKWFHVPVKVSSKQMTLEVDDFKTDVVDPAMKGITKSIEKYSLEQIKKVTNFAEYVSGVPASGKDMAEIEAQATDQGFPNGEPVWYIMNSRTKAGLITADNGKMYDASVRADGGEAFKTANFGQILGLNGLVSTLLPTKEASTATIGAVTAAPVAVSKVPVAIVLDGLGAGESITQGDIITFTNGGGDTVKVSIQTGIASATGIGDVVTAYAVSSAIEIAASASVTNIGYGCVYNSNAFALATIPLDEAMGGAESAYAYDSELGLGIRVTTNFVGLQNTVIFDILAGSDLIAGDLAFRTDLV